MTQTLPPQSARADAASANKNYLSNLSELRLLQPTVADQLRCTAVEIEWVFASDGSLTGLEPGERWWGGCSLPRRAGQFMFKTMEIPGVVACFLNPIHAAYLRVTLDRLEGHQAIVAIVPDPQVLWVMLHCEGFTKEIKSHRLWFVSGETWEQDLAKLFIENSGLPTPSQFIRAISTDNALSDCLINPAQKIFAEESNRRGAQVRALAERWPRRQRAERRLCIVAPSRFRLWNDAPIVFAKTIRHALGGEVSFCEFDSDDPSSASPLALARAGSDCDVTVTANLFRTDLPGILSDDMPLITWVTLPRVPPRESGGRLDRLLLADPAWREQAISLGWPPEQLHLAAWPISLANPAPGEQISLIADSVTLDLPRQVSEFSSHQLLWELIQSELPRDPFAIGAGADEYLTQRMARLRIAPEGFDKALFMERLIVPAYQQGLARVLIDQLRKEPRSFCLFGRGWESIAEFAPYAHGPVESREVFNDIISRSSALVHAWPSAHSHPIDAMGRSVLRAFGRTREEFCRQPVAPPINRPPLSAELVRSLLV